MVEARPKQRSIATRVILLFLLGIGANIAIAWGLAMWAPLTSRDVLIREPDVDDQRWWHDHRAERSPKSAVVVWPRGGNGAQGRMMLGDHGGSMGLSTRDGHTTFGAVVGATLDAVNDVRSGWPAASLAGSVWHFDVTLSTPMPMIGNPSPPTMNASRHSAAFEIDRPDWLGGSSYRLIPLRPVWPGFAINTILFALALWLLWATPIEVRRRLRIKRRLCATCAYPVGTSPVCTECGATLSNRAEASV